MAIDAEHFAIRYRIGSADVLGGSVMELEISTSYPSIASPTEMLALASAAFTSQSSAFEGFYLCGSAERHLCSCSPLSRPLARDYVARRDHDDSIERVGRHPESLRLSLRAHRKARSCCPRRFGLAPEPSFVMAPVGRSMTSPLQRTATCPVWGKYVFATRKLMLAGLADDLAAPRELPRQPTRRGTCRVPRARYGRLPPLVGGSRAG